MAFANMPVKGTVRWGSEQPDSQPCNQFAVQRSPNDEIVLTFGYIEPPIISGTTEEQKAQVAHIAEHGLEVHGLSRLVLTVKTAQGLHQALGIYLATEGE